VTFLVLSGKFKATAVIQEKVLSHPNVNVRWYTEVEEFIGKDSKLTQLKIVNNQTGAADTLQMDGAFIFIGLVPNTGFLENSNILLDRWGFIVTGPALLHGNQRPPEFKDRDPLMLETSIPGVFAAGDVRDTSTKQVVSAAGEGGTAALMVREYLKGV
jgi:thioredoxin reductase (NADPH)